MTSPRHLVAFAAAAFLVVPLQAQTQSPANPPAPDTPTATGEAALLPPGAGVLRRPITLGELGFAEGIEISGLSGTREFFFPVPDAGGVSALRLRLAYRSGSAFESRRSLQVEIGDRPVFTTALAAETREGTLEIPVDPALIRDGFLPVRLRYGGAITEDRCVDQRVSGAFLSIGADSGLVVDLAPGALRSVAGVVAAMPRGADILLPARPDEAQAAAALTLALGMSDTRLAPAGAPAPSGDWLRSRIGFAGSAAPSIALAGANGAPEIRLGGADPAAAARLLRSRWGALANGANLSAADSAPDAAAARRLTFADLGGDTSVQSIADRGSWTVGLPATSLPAGRRAAALSVDVAVADDGSATPPVVSVLMNGLLLGSAEAERGGRTSLRVDLPDGLVAANNSIEVAVTRQVRSGDCAYAPQGYPAQLLPSSHVVLADAGAPADFSDLAAAFAGGVTVVLPGAQALPAITGMLGTLLDGSVPIRVSYGAIPENGPYVIVSDAPPPGTAPPVRFDQGRVRILGEGEATILDEAAIGTFTVAQLLHAGDRPILWIRPGTDFASLASVPADAAGLSRGDVAFVGADGVAIAFSTARDRLIDIRYPDRTDFGALLQRYRLWLIGAGWLLVSIGFIYLLRRIYQARKTAD